jgi:hypothetical protein
MIQDSDMLSTVQNYLINQKSTRLITLSPLS